MPWPARNSAGPKWAKKVKGPTMRHFTWGRARRTAKWPTSTLRGTITRSMASAAGASPGAGSLPGKKLMAMTSLLCPNACPRPSDLLDVERLSSGRLAGSIERDLLHARLGLPQQFLAAALEHLAA